MPTETTPVHLGDQHVAAWLTSRGVSPRVNWHGDRQHAIFRHVRRASAQLNAEFVVDAPDRPIHGYLTVLNCLRGERQSVATRVRELRQRVGEHAPILVAFHDERRLLEEVFDAGATVALNDNEASSFAVVLRYLGSALRLLAADVVLDGALSFAPTLAAPAAPAAPAVRRRRVGVPSVEELAQAEARRLQEQSTRVEAGHTPPLRTLEPHERALLFAMPDDDAFRSGDGDHYDLAAIKDVTGLSLTQIARIAGVSQQALSKTPNSPRAQDGLRLLVRVVSVAREMVGPDRVRRWLNEPLKMLAGMSPAKMMEAGRTAELLAQVEAVLEGTA